LPLKKIYLRTCSSLLKRNALELSKEVPMESWDKEVDLLVMGSGAAGMSAAIRGHDLGMNVLLLESSDQYGGSTAISGGVCWVPNNPHMQKQGLEDNEADALEYL